MGWGQIVVYGGYVQLDDARKLDVSERESLLAVGSIEGLVSVAPDLQLEGLGSRDHDVRVEEAVSAEAVLARTDSVRGSLIDADKVVGGAQAADRASQLCHVPLERCSEHEAVGGIRLPLDGTEVLLHSDAGRVPQVGQVAGPALDPGSVVEGLDDRRRAAVVLHASGRSCGQTDSRDRERKNEGLISYSAGRRVFTDS